MAQGIKLKLVWGSVLCLLILANLAGTAGVWSDTTTAVDFGQIPSKGSITMIDLGADKCIPCKLMAPVLDKLKKVYAGKAAIVFIDVWKHKKQAKRFGIRTIPTQIFFDAGGREVYRHVGFMSEKAIRQQLKKMGLK